MKVLLNQILINKLQSISQDIKTYINVNCKDIKDNLNSLTSQQIDEFLKIRFLINRLSSDLHKKLIEKNYKWEQPEFILSAAIYIDDGKIHKDQPINIDVGFIITGRRHSDCYTTIRCITGDDSNNYLKNIIKDFTSEQIRKHQGFITSKNRYVDRREGWKIAIDNHQVVYGKEACEKVTEDCEEPILISENLYDDGNY